MNQSHFCKQSLRSKTIYTMNGLIVIHVQNSSSNIASFSSIPVPLESIFFWSSDSSMSKRGATASGGEIAEKRMAWNSQMTYKSSVEYVSSEPISSLLYHQWPIKIISQMIYMSSENSGVKGLKNKTKRTHQLDPLCFWLILYNMVLKICHTYQTMTIQVE